MAAAASLTCAGAAFAAKLLAPISTTRIPRLVSFPAPLRSISTARIPRLVSFPAPLRSHRHPIRRISASAAAPAATTTIAVGDKLPDATLSYFDPAGELQTVTVSELTKGKKAIVFAVPGAFTPTCSQKHLPGFVEKADELKAKGVDIIACVSVNDAFVMQAWKENLKVGDEVLLLADGNGEFTRALGVELDLRDKPVGLGVRSRRYAMLAEDGVVKVLNLEEGGAFTFSSADEMLKAL